MRKPLAFLAGVVLVVVGAVAVGIASASENDGDQQQAQAEATEVPVLAPPSVSVAFDSDTLAIDEGGADSVGYTVTEPIYIGWTCSVAGALTGDSDVTGSVDTADSEVDIAAAEDVDGEHDSATYTVTVTCTADGESDLTDSADLIVTVYDDEAPPPTVSLSLDSDMLTLDEGSVDSVGYTVTEPVGVNWSCTLAGAMTGDDDVTGTLDTTGSEVDIAAAEDVDGEHDSATYTVTVTCTADGESDLTDSADLAVTVADDEGPPASVSVAFDSDTLALDEGGSDSVGYVVTEPVYLGWTCSVAGAMTGDSDVTGSVDATASEVDIAAAEDVDDEHDSATYTVTVTCTAANETDLTDSADLVVTVYDDEGPPPSVSVTLDRDTLALDEGSTGSVGYTVTEPVGANWSCDAPAGTSNDYSVTVSPDTDDSEADVTAVHDDDAENEWVHVQLSISCHKTGEERLFANDWLIVTVDDDETPTPTLVPEFKLIGSDGQPATYDAIRGRVRLRVRFLRGDTAVTVPRVTEGMLSLTGATTASGSLIHSGVYAYWTIVPDAGVDSLTVSLSQDTVIVGTDSNVAGSETWDVEDPLGVTLAVVGDEPVTTDTFKVTFSTNYTVRRNDGRSTDNRWLDFDDDVSVSVGSIVNVEGPDGDGSSWTLEIGDYGEIDDTVTITINSGEFAAKGLTPHVWNRAASLDVEVDND